jgi:hypothetical protein
MRDDAGQHAVDRCRRPCCSIATSRAAPHAVEVGADAIGEQLDVLEVLGDVLRIVRQARVLGDVPRVPTARPPSVRMRSATVSLCVARSVANVSNSGCSGGELRALDVPVRDLDLRVQVEAIGEHGAQRIAELLAGVDGKLARGVLHGLSEGFGCSSCRHGGNRHRSSVVAAAFTVAAMRTRR